MYLIKFFCFSYRKQSIEESNLEFDKSDLDDDGFVTWREYTGVGEVYCSSSNHDFSDDAVIIFELFYEFKKGHFEYCRT